MPCSTVDVYQRFTTRLQDITTQKTKIHIFTTMNTPSLKYVWKNNLP
jgi:hypothetical protein